MKIAIRTDASRQIGTGHVMRCLALAEALGKRGAEIHFISRDLQGNILEAIHNASHRLHVLPAPVKPLAAGNGTAHAHWLEVAETTDADQCQAVLEVLGGVDLLIVDHYALDSAWEKAMRTVAKTLAVIDDLADRRHDCDLLLDQTPDARMLYEQLVVAHCRMLTGPSYALLRPEFAEWHRKSPPRDGTVRRLLVCFGGVDVANHTGQVLEAIRLLKRPDVQVDMVAGMANPHVTELRMQCAGVPNVRFIHAPSNLVELMAQADLAVGAGGVMLWERACMGLPALAVVVAENQRAVMKALTASGQIVMLEVAEATPELIAKNLGSLISHHGKLSQMSRLNHELVDGRGCERVARILMPPEIRLRPIAESDRDSLFQWRNAEEVRRYSKDTAPIPRETHDRWFSDTLTNPDRTLLIAEHRNTDVGVLRYDLEGNEALVSIYLVPGKGGQAYGPAILLSGKQWLRRHYPKILRVNAEILPGNAASQRAFEEAGYRLEQSIYRQYLHA